MFEYVEAKIQNGNADCWTAYEFLKLMKLLVVVFLQDAAAMCVLHPERKEHPIFKMPVFRDPEWPVSLFCVCACVCLLVNFFSVSCVCKCLCKSVCVYLFIFLV